MPYTIGIDARKLHDFGIGTYIRNLVRALAALDYENRYVVFYRSPAAGPRSPTCRRTSTSSPSARRSTRCASWWRCRGACSALKLDLYHATHYVLPAVVPCRVVVTIHDIIHLLYPEFLPSRLAFLYAQRMIRRGLTRGDRIITVSQNTQADLLQYFDVDGGKIEVVYNGVDDVFRQQLPPEELERALKSLELTRPYLLFVGNPAKQHKNLDNVVKAYARARQLHPFDAPLVCVGDRTRPASSSASAPPSSASATRCCCSATSPPRRCPPSTRAPACSSTRPSTKGSGCRWPRRWPRGWR